MPKIPYQNAKYSGEGRYNDQLYQESLDLPLNSSCYQGNQLSP